MAIGIKTVIYTVGDLATTKKLFAAAIGADPVVDRDEPLRNRQILVARHNRRLRRRSGRAARGAMRGRVARRSQRRGPSQAHSPQPLWPQCVAPPTTH
jgi:hypothetical protein